MGTNKSSEPTRTAEGTVIGPASFVGGRIQGDEDLTVQGRVEGELQLSRALFVESSAVVKANASVRSAVIAGVFVGNVTASEVVEVTAEGRLVGDVRTPRLIVAEGAALRGRVEMGAARASPEGERASPGRSAAAPAVVAPRAPVSARPALAQAVPVTPSVRAPAPPPRPPLVVRQPVSPSGAGHAGLGVPARPEVRPAEASKPLPPEPPPAAATVDAGRRRVLLKKKPR